MSLYPLISKPTHIKHGCHTIIDNIFTNVFSKDLSSGVIIDGTSDHFSNFLLYKFCCKNYSFHINILQNE